MRTTLMIVPSMGYNELLDELCAFDFEFVPESDLRNELEYARSKALAMCEHSHVRRCDGSRVYEEPSAINVGSALDGLWALAPAAKTHPHQRELTLLVVDCICQLLAHAEAKPLERFYRYRRLWEHFISKDNPTRNRLEQRHTP